MLEALRLGDGDARSMAHALWPEIVRRSATEQAVDHSACYHLAFGLGKRCGDVDTSDLGEDG